MRILQIIQKKQYRGAEIFCCQLSNHLDELGHNVEVCSIYDGKASLPFSKEIKSLGRNQKRRFIDYNGWKNLAGIIKEFEPDIIQANAADTLKYAVMSKWAFGWKVPLVYRNASSSSFYIKSIFSKGVNKFLLKRVDRIISVSEASKKDLNQLFPFTSSKSQVIPVGIEEKLETGDISVEFEKTKKHIIHIGSFTKEKNHNGLIRIFEKAHSLYPQIELHLLGEGYLKSEIIEKVKNSNLEKSVHFHGEIKDPFPYLKAADMLILPSIIEGLPGVILEAMYARVPVLAYNVGGIPEVITEHTGILIPKNKEIKFAEAIVNEIKNSNTLKIENAYEVVLKEYLNKKIALEFLMVYENLIHEKKK